MLFNYDISEIKFSTITSKKPYTKLLFKLIRNECVVLKKVANFFILISLIIYWPCEFL